MACKFICDGCGKECAGEYFNFGWHKPTSWYERADASDINQPIMEDFGVQTACSRECIEKIAEKTGKTALVLPI